MIEPELVGKSHGLVGLHSAVDRLIANLHRICFGHRQLFHRCYAAI